MDDYAHHPAEIAVTLAAAQLCFPSSRLVVVFQPHRFSRTKALFGDFCKAFEGVDKLLLMEIYAASEAPIPGVSGLSLAQGVRQVSNVDVGYAQSLDEMLELMKATLRPGDVLFTMGAGSVTTLGPLFLALE
jgi:UDP-N-acetylmuramate--alanine ligase